MESFKFYDIDKDMCLKKWIEIWAKLAANIKSL